MIRKLPVSSYEADESYDLFVVSNLREKFAASPGEISVVSKGEVSSIGYRAVLQVV